MGPMESAGDRVEGDVNPHWVLSIVVTILFFPIGLLALVFSYMSSNATSAELAAKYAKYAKTAGMALICVAVVLWVLIIVLFVVVGVDTHLVTGDVSTADQTGAVASAEASYYLAAASNSTPNYALDANGGPTPNFTSAVAGATAGLDAVTYTYGTATVVVCAPTSPNGSAPTLVGTPSC